MSLLPREWCRGPQWLSPAAQAEWEPVLRAAQAAWEELEPASITEGVRNSALLFLTVDELVRASTDCAAYGLEVVPLAAAGAQVRVAVTRPGLSPAWRRAWAASDDEAIGQLLGFPVCCRHFFQETWGATGTRDVTRAMRTVEGPWQANTMLRWLGVRLVPHLPCSADCPATIDRANQFFRAGQHAGIEVDAIERLLRLPVTYSALGGVAVIETPHFRFMAGTDPTEQEERRERVAQLVGDGHQDVARIIGPETWEDNGFSSWDAMQSAHAVVLRAVGEVGSALDLGSGDGRLLHRIADGRLGHRWVGVESDHGRVRRGEARHAPVVELLNAKIEDGLWRSDPSQKYDVALLMPGRLLEMEPRTADAVRSWLHHAAARVVVYAYGDVLQKHRGLDALADAAGIDLVYPYVFNAEGQGQQVVQAAEGRLR